MPLQLTQPARVALFSLSILGLATGCQTQVKEVSEPLSIVYGSKVDNGKGIFISDANGEQRRMVIKATLSDGYPDVSPNGRHLAFYGKYDDYKTWSIHTVDMDGNNLRRLTDVKHVWDSAPAWSPDGNTIVFAREYKNDAGDWQEEIWLMNADGSNQRQLVGLEGRSPVFLNDGRLLFQSKSSPSQISIADLDGSNLIRLTDDDTNNMSPKISPDGLQIAYLSNRDGNQEVYVMDIDGDNQARLTHNDIQEWDPAWSLDCNQVFFSSQNVHGFYDIYKVNTDGSSTEKVTTNSSQTGSVRFVDMEYVNRLGDPQ